MRTIEQERAANALSRIKDLSDRSDGFKRYYRAYLDRLGPTILMNGLGQALASERAAASQTPKREDEQAHHELFVSLHKWLCRKETGVYPPSAELIKAIMENEESLYLRAQVEALTWIGWHKKFCRALFPKSEEE